MRRNFKDLSAPEVLALGHRRRLIDMFRKKFGEEIPLVRRQDVRGFVRRDPVQSLRVTGVDHIRRRVALMELETARDYRRLDLAPPQAPAAVAVAAAAAAAKETGAHT